MPIWNYIIFILKTALQSKYDCDFCLCLIDVVTRNQKDTEICPVAKVALSPCYLSLKLSTFLKNPSNL